MMAIELKNELLAFSKKLIGSTTFSSRAIFVKCLMARLSATVVARRRWRESCSMQKYGVSNNSWIRMICAPCFAAWRTSFSALAMFASTSQPQANCVAATTTSRFGSIEMRGSGSCEHLAGIEDAFGIERLLEQSHGGDLRRRARQG